MLTGFAGSQTPLTWCPWQLRGCRCGFFLENRLLGRAGCKCGFFLENRLLRRAGCKCGFFSESPLETGRLQVWAADKICWQDLSHHGPNATTIEGVGLGGEAALLVIIQSRVVAGIGPLVFGLILKAATSAQTFVAHPDHHTPITTPPPRHPHHHPHHHAPTPHPHNTHCAQNWVRLGCIQTETAFKANPQPWPFKIHLCNIYAGFVLYLGRACLFVALICSTEQQSQPDVHISVCHMTAASCKP